MYFICSIYDRNCIRSTFPFIGVLSDLHSFLRKGRSSVGFCRRTASILIELPPTPATNHIRERLYVVSEFHGSLSDKSHGVAGVQDRGKNHSPIYSSGALSNGSMNQTTPIPFSSLDKVVPRCYYHISAGANIHDLSLLAWPRDG